MSDTDMKKIELGNRGSVLHDKPASNPLHGLGIIGRTVLAYLALAVAATFSLLPFVWMLSTSLKPASEVLSTTPAFIPAKATLDNYSAIVDAFPLGRICLIADWSP